MLGESADFLLPVATHVLVASCKGAVAIALVLLCRKLFATRLSAQARHGLWLAVLVSLFLPWGFELPIELRRDLPAVATQLVEVEGPAVNIAPAAVTAPLQSATPALQLSVVELPSGGIPTRSWIVLSWAAVVVVLAAIPVLQLFRYRRIAAKAASVSGPAVDLLLQCRTRLGLRRSVRLLESTDIASPAVFGWQSPTLLLPIGLLERFGAGQLRHVFLHELAHVQRHDILVNWIMTGAQILHWFNPLVWYGMRVMRADMEQACDARVLGRLSPEEHADYGHALIGVWDAFPGRAPSYGLGVVDSHGQLKERINMIAKFSSRKVRSPVLVMVLLLGLASVAATQPRVGAPVPQIAIKRVPDNALRSVTPIQMAQAAQRVPALAPAPPVAQRGTATTEPVPAARAVVPFTVQLLPPEITGADEAVHALLQKHYLTLAAKLRAVPSLTLLTPESTGRDSDTINFQIEFKVTVREDGAQLVRMNARTLSQPSGEIAGSRPDAAGRISIGGGSLGTSTRWGTIKFAPEVWAVAVRKDPERDLDSFVERARMTIFPADPYLQQDLLSRLRDPKLDSSLRMGALDLLLSRHGGRFGSEPDAAVISGGMEYARMESDPGRRVAIWERLTNATSSPELAASLIQALGAEKDEEVRIQLALSLEKFGADPLTRAALESVARTDPRQLTRMIAQHLLTGDAAWNDFVLATLKNPQLSDSQRIEPLRYASASNPSPIGPAVLDDEAIRILGNMVTRMKAYSDGAGVAFALRGSRNPVVLEVITNILRPGEGQPSPPREVRDVVLMQLSDAMRNNYDPRARALVEDIAAHDPDSWMRERARSMLDAAARSN